MTIEQKNGIDFIIQQAIRNIMVKNAATFGEFSDVDTEEKSAQYMKMATGKSMSMTGIMI